MKYKLNSILWIIPFISFLLGYFTINLVFSVNKKITVPSVVGLQFKDAAKNLSEKNLNIRILAEKVDDDLPDGTIITQSPFETEVKHLQSIYLTISKKPDQKLAPDFSRKEIYEINKFTQKNGIKVKSYLVPSNLKKSSCIAQFPKIDEPLEDNRITIYISNGDKKKVIFPDLRGLELQNALEFLNLYSIKPNVIENENKKQKIITEQRPLPGSIVDLDKINVQLKTN